jgi:muconate cycloisomerase
VPRSYVTGETIESTFAALRGFDAARVLGLIREFGEAVGRVAAFELPRLKTDDVRCMSTNAARCALEVALLDALGRHFGKSVGDAFSTSDAARTWSIAEPEAVRYSGAITAATRRAERFSAWKMRLYGFKDVKVKVGVEGQDDPARLRTLRRILGSKTDLRLDANEAWDTATLAEQIEPLRRFRPSVLEQPVPHAQVEALAELRPRIGIPVMLDESLCGWPDALAAVEHGWADFLNVRLSKCGGIFPSLRMMDLAWRNGLGVQLGCHPGETGILSAAGRQVACRFPRIRYLEGSYDRHVLAENLLVGDITFSYGGRAQPLPGPGLGVTIDPERLLRLTVRTEGISYD